MKKILTALFLINCLSTVFAQSTISEYKDSGFKIGFPSKPAIENQSTNSAFGKIDIVTYVYEAETFNIMVSETKYEKTLSEKINSESGIKGLLDGARNGALKNLAKQIQTDYKIVTEERFKFKNIYPSLKTIAKLGDINVTALYISKNNQLFQVLILGDTSNSKAQEIMNSFDII